MLFLDCIVSLNVEIWKYINYLIKIKNYIIENKYVYSYIEIIICNIIWSINYYYSLSMLMIFCNIQLLSNWRRRQKISINIINYIILLTLIWFPNRRNLLSTIIHHSNLYHAYHMYKFRRMTWLFYFYSFAKFLKIVFTK